MIKTQRPSGQQSNQRKIKMSYDAFLDRCLDEHLQEDQYCEDCGHMECRCDDDCGDADDFDADDFETVFDHETGQLEVVR